MKTWTVVALLGVLVATSVASAQAPDLDRMDFVLKSVPDGPVAKVNGVSIPAEEFITLYRTELASIAMQTGKKVLPDEVRLEAALHSISLLVQREVLAQEATRRGIKVTSAEEEEGWKKEVENVGKRLSGGSGKIPTEAEMLEWSGLTKEEAMAEVHKEILIDKAREGIARDAGVTVTDKEVAAFFEEK
ncbi:MAG: PpiC protein, partial [Candidatus Hydrogenedentes bacterium]|nr:PpiC protein [Candidatus Hydrogenedentota bacterium]